MEGRRIHGEGLEHEQDYVRERLEQAGDTDEFEGAAERLEQELQDLQGNGSDQAGQASDVDITALQKQAVTPVEQMEVRQGAELDSARGSQVNPDHMTPDAEARSRVEGGRGGYGNLST